MSFLVVSKQVALIEETQALGRRLLGYVNHCIDLVGCTSVCLLKRQNLAEEQRFQSFLRQLYSIQAALIDDLDTASSKLNGDPIVHIINNPAEDHSLSAVCAKGQLLAALRRVRDLCDIISKQAGLIRYQPRHFAAYGEYRPSLSICHLAFAYGREEFIIRPEDFTYSVAKLLTINSKLAIRGICLKVQPSYFRTLVFPLTSYGLQARPQTPLEGEASNANNKDSSYATVLELVFNVEYQGCSGKVVVNIELDWLFVRRPFFLAEILNTKADPKADVQSPQLRGA